MRLDKFLGITGCCSRTDAKRAGRAGKVEVNGVAIKVSDANIDPENDVVIFCGKVMFFKEQHSKKTLSPILATLSGISIPSKFGQFENAALPIVVTPSGIVIFNKPLQSANANSAISVTLPSVGIVLFWQPKTKSLFSVFMIQFPLL